MPKSATSPSIDGLMCAGTSFRENGPILSERKRVEYTVVVPFAVCTGKASPFIRPRRLATLSGMLMPVAPVSTRNTISCLLAIPLTQNWPNRSARIKNEALPSEPSIEIPSRLCCLSSNQFCAANVPAPSAIIHTSVIIQPPIVFAVSGSEPDPVGFSVFSSSLFTWIRYTL